MAKSWMPNHPEVHRSWPPHYLVGKQVQDEPTTQLAEYEDDFCKVQLLEVPCEFMFSNPTGAYNLSVPEKLLHNSSTYTYMSYQQFKNE